LHGWSVNHDARICFELGIALVRPLPKGV
jgi:hypothetical protein